MQNTMNIVFQLYLFCYSLIECLVKIISKVQPTICIPSYEMNMKVNKNHPRISCHIACFPYNFPVINSPHAASLSSKP